VQTFPRDSLFDAIERLVVVVLANGDVGQKPRPGEPPLNRAATAPA